MVKAVFLDRDGVIVVPEFRDGRSFAPRRLRDLELYPDARDCLTRLKKAGYGLIVVTNQPDVGHGHISLETVEAMHREILDQLPVDLIKVCYHKPGEGCRCRKPKPGMLLDAASEFKIDLSRSIMVGDRASDVMAGLAAGCKTVLIDHGYAETNLENPTFVATSLVEATNWILSNSTPLAH